MKEIRLKAIMIDGANKHVENVHAPEQGYEARKRPHEDINKV